jgi:hypothetical protein
VPIYIYTVKNFGYFLFSVVLSSHDTHNNLL